jgi:hypothetical protein
MWGGRCSEQGQQARSLRRCSSGTDHLWGTDHQYVRLITNMGI